MAYCIRVLGELGISSTWGFCVQVKPSIKILKPAMSCSQKLTHALNQNYIIILLIIILLNIFRGEKKKEKLEDKKEKKSPKTRATAHHVNHVH